MAHHDAVLTGRRFLVARRATPPHLLTWSGPHEHADWSSIRRRLQDAALSTGTRGHAIGIFDLLARAEARVHGIDAEAVTFHEVGAWDSVADVVGAAELIEALGASHWSCAALPIGTGRVRCAHGIVPVPAPATAMLLLGMPTLDDGIAGERVTPTGAAILRHLCHTAPGGIAPSPVVRTLKAVGTGFGTRALTGISNHLRALCFEPAGPLVPAGETGREIHVLEFEVDDQSGEDLAAGLDRVRADPAVIDVIQAPVFGKKGRMMVHVRVLVRRPCLEQAVQVCFRETSTIGLRHRLVQGIGLKRHIEAVEVDGRPVRVKVAERPGGATAKAECDDVAQAGHSARQRLRARAERSALSRAQPRAVSSDA